MTPRWWTLVTMRERCSECRIPFVPGHGESVGGVEVAVYVSALLGMLGVMALLVAGAPAWAAFAWAFSFGVLFPLLTYRNAKGLWVGTMYAMQAWPPEGDAPHVAPVKLPRLPWDDP